MKREIASGFAVIAMVVEDEWIAFGQSDHACAATLSPVFRP